MRYGFINTKEKIKLLILYSFILLPFCVDFETIIHICTSCDNGFGYFEFKEAFNEIINTKHIQKTKNEKFTITEKGREAIELFENKIPYTVRKSAQKSTIKVIMSMHENAKVNTSIKHIEHDKILVTLSIDDTFCIQMKTADKNQSKLIEQNLKKNAQNIYNTILQSLYNDCNI